MMAQAKTANIPFGQKVNEFARMFREKDISSAEAELKELVELLNHAGEERNELMHSAWSYSSRWSGQLTRMKAAWRSKTLSRRLHRMSAPKIEETRKRIEEAFQSLARFTMKYIQTPELEGENQDNEKATL